MIKDLVSVIVPTHNRAKMLKRAIKSIQNQTYENIEIIIIGNGCTDNTQEVVEDLQNNCNNIVFLNFKESLGGAEARNKGLDVINGEFVAFLDDDDEWLSLKLERQLEILKKSDYCIVGSNYKQLNIYGKTSLVKLPENIDFYQMTFENVLGSYSFCITKKEYIKDLRINPNLKANQDWDLWLKILFKTGKNAYVLQEYLVKYYIHDNKISNNYQNKVEAQEIFMNDWKNKFSAESMDYQYIKLLFYKFLRKRNFFYIKKLGFIFRVIFKSPYRYNCKKYYIYLNIFRYIK